MLNDGFNISADKEWELLEQGKLSITKEETWERIFEIETSYEQENENKNRIQGVTGRIYLSEIQEIEDFLEVRNDLYESKI